jgi:O-antigen/teichoic acid export membrane protein
LAKEIRVQYSGLIYFGARLITVATGILFALLLGSLSQEKLGAWGTFFTIIVPYFTLLSGALSFWTLRFVARDKEGAAKTGIVVNLTVATIATLIYLALLPLVTQAFSLQNYVLAYVLVATQIMETYLITVLESCLQAQRPQFVAYGLLIGEVLKVVLAYTFVIALHWDLVGIILSLAIGFGIKIPFYLKNMVMELRQKFVFSHVKEWLKGSTFNLYSVLGDRIASVLFIMLSVYGHKVGVSYYTAAQLITSVITYSGGLAFALYPKILAERKTDEVTSSLRMVLMFAIPMAAGVIAIPNSYLLFFNVSGTYLVATPVLIILAIDALVQTNAGFFTSVLYGIESLDEEAKIPLRQVVKSRLFISFSLTYFHSAITLPTAFYALTFLAHNDPLLVAAYVTGILMMGHLISFLVLLGVLHRAVRLTIPWKSIAKYAVASAIMALILIAGHPVTRISTLIFTGVGALAYLGLLVAFDKETRNLAKTILGTLKTKFETGSQHTAPTNA